MAFLAMDQSRAHQKNESLPRMALAANGQQRVFAARPPAGDTKTVWSGPLNWQRPNTLRPETGFADDPIELAKPHSQRSRYAASAAGSGQRAGGGNWTGLTLIICLLMPMRPPEREERWEMCFYRHAQPAPVVPDEIKHRIGWIGLGMGRRV